MSDTGPMPIANLADSQRRLDTVAALGRVKLARGCDERFVALMAPMHGSDGLANRQPARSR